MHFYGFGGEIPLFLVQQECHRRLLQEDVSCCSSKKVIGLVVGEVTDRINSESASQRETAGLSHF